MPTGVPPSTTGSPLLTMVQSKEELELSLKISKELELLDDSENNSEELESEEVELFEETE